MILKQLFAKNHTDFMVDSDDPKAVDQLASALLMYLPKEDVKIQILCIGTDRVTGDSLGPIVGSFLLEKNLPERFAVVGTLENPMHAIHLSEFLREKNTIETVFTIAVDASLSNNGDHIGKIRLKSGPIQPGLVTRNPLPAVGDISITGVVNKTGDLGLSALQSTRLFIVMKMAKIISEAIGKVALEIENHQSK